MVRWSFWWLAIAVVAAHAWFVNQYHTPAHYGSNQNAYLSAGRFIAESGSPALRPVSHYDFVGWMWNLTSPPSTQPADSPPRSADASTRPAADSGSTKSAVTDPTYYPKYPIGLPLIYAAAYRLGGWPWAYYVAPAAASLAVLGVFYLGRAVAFRAGGSLVGLASMSLYAALPLPLLQANNPYSHAPSAAVTVWGLYFLVSFYNTGWFWRGIVGAALLGAATSIRYTDGLFVLPVLLIVVAMLRRRPRSSVITLAAWIAPVAALAIYNWMIFGSLTGYDSTNESTGFTWKEFGNRWPQTVNELFERGLPWVLPLSMLGMMIGLVWRWIPALTLWAAILPTAAIYTAYYWGANLPASGFLRFFACTFPPAAVAAGWVVGRLALADRRRFAGGLAAMGLIAVVSVLNIRTAMPPMERDRTVGGNLADAGSQIRAIVPQDSIVIGQSQRLLNFLQTTDSYRLIASDYVAGDRPIPGGRTSPDKASPFQIDRVRLADAVFDGTDASDRFTDVGLIIRAALDSGRRAFIVVSPGEGERLSQGLAGFAKLYTREIRSWPNARKMGPEAFKTTSALLTDVSFAGASGNWRLLEITTTAPASTQPVATRPANMSATTAPTTTARATSTPATSAPTTTAPATQAASQPAQ